MRSGIAVLLLTAACVDSDMRGVEGDDTTSDSIVVTDSAADSVANADTSTAVQSPATSGFDARTAGDSLRAALDRLVDGPAAGAAAEGVETWFSVETADVVRSVNVDSTGHAVVDFRDLRSLITNASSSAGSEMLLNELNQTVFSVRGVRSVEYRMDGSCDGFWEWLQYSCQTVTTGFIDDGA